MTENTGTDIEIIGRATPPRLSDDGIAYQRSLLANARWCEENPAHADMLRRTLTEALAATAQDQPPPEDKRTSAQRLIDRQFGVSFAPDGTVELPANLAAIIEREGEAEPPDRQAVAAELKAAGMDPKKALANAQALLDKTGSPIKAEKLGAHSLAQLSLYADHLQKHAASCPQ